jgi:apolipoprotein N-acyltransferase
LLIFAEELLSVFDKADDYYDCGAGHAHKEQDLQNVHCEQSYLKHENDSNPEGRKFPRLNFVRIERFGPIHGRAAGKLLCLFEIETDCGLYALGVGSGLFLRDARRRSAKLSRMRGIPWRLLAAGALTAFLLDLPFPLAGPLPIWRTVFAWFALAPLLVALLGLPQLPDSKPLRWSFLAGWLTGALWFGSNCYWVYNTMHLYGGMDKPMAVVCLVAFSLYLGFWFGVFALALGVARRATVGGKFAWIGFAAIPFLWTAMEFALARIPQFPWDQMGYSQVDNALLTRLAPWTGVYGISFLLAGVNALFAAALLPVKSVTTRREAYFSVSLYCGGVGVVIAFAGMMGAAIHAPALPTGATVVLVQPNLNVDTDDVWVGPEWDRHLAQFQTLARKTCKNYIPGMPETGVEPVDVSCYLDPYPQLIVWPESPAPFHDADARFRSAMASVAQADKAAMIVGAVGMDEDAAAQQYRIYNSAEVVGQDGSFVGRYDKIHLVPFGEYVPFRKLLFFVRKITQNLPDTGTGSERKTFTIGGRRYGVFICYESVFGDEVRQFARNGAEVFVNISDDGWYGDTSAPWQHLNMARMRAIENRRWILRDTNNGVTAAIDPYGTVRQSIPRHQVDALPAQYGYSSKLTFYTVHGDWLPGLCAILSLALLVWSGRTILWESPSRTSAQSE